MPFGPLIVCYLFLAGVGGGRFFLRLPFVSCRRVICVPKLHRTPVVGQSLNWTNYRGPMQKWEEFMIGGGFVFVAALWRANRRRLAWAEAARDQLA